MIGEVTPTLLKGENSPRIFRAKVFDQHFAARVELTGKSKDLEMVSQFFEAFQRSLKPWFSRVESMAVVQISEVGPNHYNVLISSPHLRLLLKGESDDDWRKLDKLISHFYTRYCWPSDGLMATALFSRTTREPNLPHSHNLISVYLRLVL